MAKFNAGTAVEKLEYDFSDYNGGKGFIPEPSTAKVNGFFRASKKMVAEIKSIQGSVKDLDIEEMSDEDAMKAVDSLEDVGDVSARMNDLMVANLAELCGGERDENDELVVHGGSPSQADLQNLPFRVLQAFSVWLMDQIKPKRTTPGSKR